MVAEILLWLLTLIGHCALWCVVFNQVHATACPRPYRKYSELLIFAAVFLPMIGTLVYFLVSKDFGFWSAANLSIVVKLYLFLAIAVGVIGILRWAWRKTTVRLPSVVASHQHQLVNIEKELKVPLLNDSFSKVLGWLPMNQVGLLAIEKFTFEFQNLPKALDGLTVCQISDLHFTGQMCREYFEEVVRNANELNPDIVVITGDIVDSVDCMDWIESVLSKLKSKHGIYYIFGNHDLRIPDEASYRKRLADIGFIGVNGQWTEIEIKGETIVIAGNALPWFPGAENLATRGENEFKILLSHSPDQLNWAKPYHFDMMFAGHTHGGQIVFPIIGAVVAPSRYGIKYCNGTFMLDEMLMHVSRGISGDEQIRVNCAPELGFFTFKCSD